MKAFIVFCMVIAAVVAQQDVPIPYSFNYNAATEDGGSSSHEESGDGSGSVRGSYTVNNLEGHSRTVEYIADDAGFRATVRTNEPGTANINPADVVMESSAVEVGGAPTYTTNVVSRQPAPVAAPVPRGQAGSRFVLVPITDPRARGYY